LIRLAVRCRPELAEEVLAELVVLAPNGVEEDRGDGYVEYAIYGAPGELPALPDLEAATGGGLVDVESTEIPDDWADRWQDFHQPLLVGGRLWVRPSWVEPREGTIDLVVDPGQAFGTGAHPTTRMCLELLAELADAGEAHGALADWGTGSGVLAIAAAKLGFAPVVACDHEPAALEAAATNAAANGIELDLRRLNLRSDPPPAASTAVANLTAPILREVVPRLDPPPERLICSGLLASEADGIRDAFAGRGLEERARRQEGDWVALLLAHQQRAPRGGARAASVEFLPDSGNKSPTGLVSRRLDAGAFALGAPFFRASATVR
jgi:ribosomal protein L11 methyltransferase